MSTLFALDLFAIIALLFTVSLAKRHIIQNHKNTYHIIAAYMTIALLILEILANLIIIPRDADYIVMHKLINSLGFALSPAVPYVFLKFIGTTDDRYGSRTLWIVPLVINTLLSLSSYWTGLIFSIDTVNHYIRGSVFFLPTTVSMIYYGVVIYEILKNRAKVARPDTLILLMIFLLPVVCTVIQITFPHLLLIWPSVALSLLLYYVYSLELQYDYDIQSQIKNRTAFDKEMARFATKTNVTIFVFDLNNLKKVNDTFGHSEGDKLIKSAAIILNTCFSDVGDAFRIGGDEFSVICPDLNDDAADALLISLKHLIDSHNQAVAHRLELAQGYAHYDIHSNETIYATLSRADDAMYAHKAYYKATFERRAFDH